MKKEDDLNINDFDFDKLFNNAEMFFYKGKDRDIIYPPKTGPEIAFIRELSEKCMSGKKEIKKGSRGCK
ncbi:hypothetical protein SAMN05444673_3914 [Bacillus sp. OV166]|uniref:hypothetical protein n=1 Tax=Bacillus sp. OV166 TaxID=1882763 RepID=UPI000A2AD322|nr:hypothetical protein [Bacillus sp. OV166]SMQ80342.1 hypothetical protein SAMN05444673_3914 [Bacillus sp. OV166]